MICVTNRKDVSDDFLDRIALIGILGARAIILREKDLSESEYDKLARQCCDSLGKNRDRLILHSHMEVARRLNIRKIHLPYRIFIESSADLDFFDEIGVSVHSMEEAVSAEKRGATYLIAGHVFTTACKAGLPPRGIAFVEEVCAGVDIPVYPIGGIDGSNRKEVIAAGATDTCAMSSLMQCPASMLKEILDLPFTAGFMS